MNREGSCHVAGTITELLAAFAKLITVESASNRATAGVRAALSIRPRSNTSPWARKPMPQLRRTTSRPAAIRIHTARLSIRSVVRRAGWLRTAM